MKTWRSSLSQLLIYWIGQRIVSYGETAKLCGMLKRQEIFQQSWKKFSCFWLLFLKNKDVASFSYQEGLYTGISPFAFKKQHEGQSDLFVPAVFKCLLLK